MNKPLQIVLTVLIISTGCSGKVPVLGVENAQLMPCSATSNCVSSQAKGQKNYIEPIRIMGHSLSAKSLILKSIGEWSRAQIIVAEDHYIKSEFTSRFFRFVDDVEFYFPDTKSKEIIIHIRSASRVGIFDFGVNRKRVEKIRMKIETINNEQKGP